MTTWHPRANGLFLRALEVHSASERNSYLDEACGGDAELRAEVESLLEASDRAGSFLESPAVGVSAPACGSAIGMTTTFETDRPRITEAAGTTVGPYKLL